MKSNDSLFRKAYNNHHDKNGSDVSSTADDFMRSDIGDGVFLDGENFRNANGDGFNSDVVFESDAGLSWDANLIKFFIEIIHSEYGCNPNVDLDAINQIVSPYALQLGEGVVGNPEFLGEVRNVYMYACGLNQPSSSGGVDISDEGNLTDISIDKDNGYYSDPIPLGGDSGGNPNLWQNDTEHAITLFQPFQTQQIGMMLNYADGDFSTIQPTQNGTGECVGVSDNPSEFQYILGNTPQLTADPIVTNELMIPINQWAKLDVTACFGIMNVTGANERALVQWADSIYVKIIGAYNYYNFLPFFKIGFYVSTGGGFVEKSIEQVLSAYNELHSSSAPAWNAMVVRPLTFGEDDGVQAVRTLGQLIQTQGMEISSEGGIGDLYDDIIAPNPPNPPSPYGGNPTWITANTGTQMMDVPSCYELQYAYDTYKPYLTAYTAFNFGDVSGNALSGQDITPYIQQAMASYDNYISLVVAGLLCAAGMDENPNPDMESFWNSLPESCQLQSFMGDGNNGEGVYNDEPPVSNVPLEDGGMVAPNDDLGVSYLDEVPNSSKNFSNANGSNNNALIEQLNYIKNWFKDNPIDKDLFASGESLEVYQISNGQMGGGASNLQQIQNQAFNPNSETYGLGNSWAINRFKNIQDWYKIANFVEIFFGVFVRVANCLPTDVKNAGTSLLQEIIARNTEFFIVETDEEQQFRDMFQELGMPIPTNFFREYTSLEYNELANQLAQSENVILGLTGQIDSLNSEYMMVQQELNNIMNMMEYEQDNTQELEMEISILMTQRADLEAQLMMFMNMLSQTEMDFMEVIEENGMLQAELGASNQLQMVLQDQFDTAVMNEMALHNMVDALQSQLMSSNNEIGMLQSELSTVINELVTSLEAGENLQNALQTQLAMSDSQISQLTSQIAALQTQLAISQGQIEANTINQQDVAYYENQISNLNQANQSLLLTIQEMEMQTGQTPANLGSGKVKVQGEIDMKTGKGTIQILKGKPKKTKRVKKPTISKSGKRLNFVEHNPMKDLNPWNYMDGEHRRFNNSYDLDN